MDRWKSYLNIDHAPYNFAKLDARKHLFDDLRPYVCTFEQCDLRMFADRVSWLRHEVDTHRVEWFCSFCSHSIFNCRAHLESHMQENHGDHFRHDQLPALIDASKRSTDGISADSCPFCFKYGEKQKSMNAHLNIKELFIDVKDFRHFYRHVGKHMEQLALFALPMITGMQEEDFESAEAHSGAGTDSRSTRFDLTDSSSSNDGRDVITESRNVKEDPPLHLAAFNGRVGEVKARLRKGEDPNTTGSTWGNTLGAAVAGQQTKVVKLLIKNGAQADIPSMGYTTVIHASFGQSRKKTIRKMLLTSFVTNKGSSYLTTLKAEVKSTVELLQSQVATLTETDVFYFSGDMGSYLCDDSITILRWLFDTYQLIDPDSDTQYFNLMGKYQVFLRSLRRTCALIKLILNELGLAGSINFSPDEWRALQVLIKRKMRVVNERSSDLSLLRLFEEYRSQAAELYDRVKRSVSLSRSCSPKHAANFNVKKADVLFFSFRGLFEIGRNLYETIDCISGDKRRYSRGQRSHLVPPLKIS